MKSVGTADKFKINLVTLMKKLAILLFAVGLGGCVGTTQKINSLYLGMSKAEVVNVMGKPVSTRATSGIEYIIYDLKLNAKIGQCALMTLGTLPIGGIGALSGACNREKVSYFIALQRGRVSSYGKLSDFSSTGNSGSTYTPQQQSEPATSFKSVFRNLPRSEKHLLQVNSHENCALWDISPYKATKVTWSGQCKDGWAIGSGDAIFHYPYDGQQVINTAQGEYRVGKVQGYWLIKSTIAGSDFSESSGLFHNGDYLGEWKTVLFNGAVMVGSYKDNQLHGTWKFRTPAGQESHLEFANGRLQE